MRNSAFEAEAGPVFIHFHSTFFNLLFQITMNYQDLFRNWDEKKATLKKMFAHLADHDLELEEGRDYELMLRLQRKLGKSETQLMDILLQLDDAPVLK
jgi:hypothetical protein